MRCLPLLLCCLLAMAAEAQPTVHVTTERAWYRPEEVVCLRALLLDALSRAPLASTLPVTFRITDGRGQTVWVGMAAVEDGVAAASWTAGAEGGAFGVTASIADRASSEPHRILVARSEEGLGSRVGVEIAFDRRGYVPGDAAEVRLVLRDRSGAPVAGRPATLRVVLAGGVAREERVVSDAEGRAGIRVSIPADLARPEGTVTASIAEAGSEVLASRSVPLASAELDLQAVVEGGALVAGLPAAVHLQARSCDGQPVDCRGSLVDAAGRTLAGFSSRHEGRCRVDFTPLAGTAYRLRVEEPLLHEVALPVVRPAGAVLLGDSVQSAGRPLRLGVVATYATGTCRLLIQRRGITLIERPVILGPGETPIELGLTSGQAGVVDAILIDPDGGRCAQRTLFLRPARRLDLGVDVPAVAGPEDTAMVTLRLTDAAGAPVRGLCSLSVVEAGDEDLIEARERPPRLPAVAWLEGEVEELADSGSYLADEAGAAGRLGLLLGVQGWRHAEGTALPDRLRRLRGPRALVLPGLLALPFDVTPTALDIIAEMGSQGAFTVIGVGGGNAGLFGSRSGGGRKRTPARDGASPASENSVFRVCRFLKRHQSPDGRWSATDWPQQSAQEVKAEGLGTWTGEAADRCTTALAVLAFLGAGYNHKTPNVFRSRLRLAVPWLVGQVAADGRIDPDPVVQSTVVLALTEAYAMTCDPDLRAPAQNALAALRRRQHRAGGWAASGDPQDPRLDAVASAWCVMALKSGYAAGLDVGDSLIGARSYLDAAWKAANPEWKTIDVYNYRGIFPGTFDAVAGTAHAPERTAAGACMAAFLGHHAGDPLLESLAHRVCDQPPLAAPFDPLHVYWGTLAIFQLGGDRWQNWNAGVRDLLVSLQCVEGAVDGSWDPAIYGATGGRWGRVLASAVTVLDLEIYYRYGRIARATGADVQPLRADLRRLVLPGEVDQAGPPGTLAWWAAEPSGADGRLQLRLPAAGRARRLTVRADALDAQGGFAVAETSLEIRKPVEITARLPGHLLVGDRWSVPLGLRGAQAAEVAVEGAACRARVEAGRLEIEALAGGTARVRLSAVAAAGRDGLSADIEVGEPGVRWQDGAQRCGDTVLEQPVAGRFLPGSLRGRIVVESGFAGLLDAVHGAFAHEPRGCFEQTSSTSYPLLVSCERRRARTIIDDGSDEIFLAAAVARLQGFACPSGGFSLFGRDPGDPILTAHGLRQLRRLGGIVAVDAGLLDRQRSWLLAQRRPDGGFACTTLAAPPALADVQIASDLGAGCPPDDRQRAYAAARADGGAYAIGLAARLAREVGDAQAAVELAGLLRLDAAGCAQPAGASPWRPDARSEATALVVSACLDSGRDEEALRGLDWLGNQRRGAAWDMTQVNVLAIEAFAAAESLETRTSPTTIHVHYAGRDPGSLTIPSGQADVLGMPLKLDPAGGSLPITVEGSPTVWRWLFTGQLLKPTDAVGAPLALTLRAPARLAAGSPCEVLVGVRAGEDVYAPMVRVGLPASLEPRAESLDRLVRSGRLGCWEWTAGELRLYGERLAKGAVWEVPVACIAVAAGSSRGRPSSAYPYYQPARTAWQAGLEVAVTP